MPAAQQSVVLKGTRQLTRRLRIVDGTLVPSSNLLTAPQSGNLADYPVNGNVTASTALDILGIRTGLVFGDNSLTRFAYKNNFATVNGKTYRMSALIKMDDNGLPVPSNASNTGDFAFVIDGSIIGTNITVRRVAGSVYRCSMDLTSAGALANNGVIKYNTQSARSFTVTDYHLQLVS